MNYLTFVDHSGSIATHSLDFFFSSSLRDPTITVYSDIALKVYPIFIQNVC